MAAQVCAALCFALLPFSVASQWPVGFQSGPDLFPNIELSLAPPLHPWPQVAAELGKLEESREHVEAGNMYQLQLEFNKAAVAVPRQIGDIVGRAMRVFDDPVLAKEIFAQRGTHKLMQLSTVFRQTPQEALASSVLSVKVNVAPASPPDPSLRARIDNVEYQRSKKEKDNLFESALAEVKALTDFILSELEVQIRRNVNSMVGTRALSFLQTLSEQSPSQANVQVVPARESYPTVASMVNDMEMRRDLTENLERRRVLEKCMDFVMVCNDAAERALKTAVARILAQYAGGAKSLRHHGTA